MAYLYRHIRLDKNEPFYIGVSIGRRKSHKGYIFKYHNDINNAATNQF